MFSARSAAPDALFVVDLDECAESAFAVDPHRRIVFWNAAAQELLGYSAPEALGARCCDVLDSGGVASGACALCLRTHPSSSGETLRQFEMRAVTREGETKYLYVTTLRVSSAEGEPRIIHLLRENAPPRAALQPQAAAVAVDAPPAHTAPHLTSRELEVLRLLASGLSTAEIATALSISPITARNHITRVIEKLEVKTRLQAVIAASRRGLI